MCVRVGVCVWLWSSPHIAFPLQIPKLTGPGVEKPSKKAGPKPAADQAAPAANAPAAAAPGAPTDGAELPPPPPPLSFFFSDRLPPHHQPASLSAPTAARQPGMTASLSAPLLVAVVFPVSTPPSPHPFPSPPLCSAAKEVKDKKGLETDENDVMGMAHVDVEKEEENLFMSDEEDEQAPAAELKPEVRPRLPPPHTPPCPHPDVTSSLHRHPSVSWPQLRSE